MVPADSTAIGQGTSFLTNKDLVRGFKIHCSVVDPLASALVAQTVDIEIAGYDVPRFTSRIGQHDGTCKNEHASQPVMPSHAFVQKNCGQHDGDDDAEFVHRGNLRRFAKLQGAEIAKPGNAGGDSRKDQENPRAFPIAENG